MRRSPFHPSRGGHAPRHLLNAFDGLLRLYVSLPAGHTDEASLLAAIRTITGKLWNCIDTMLNGTAYSFGDMLELHEPFPVTYAQGARLLRTHAAEGERLRQGRLRQARLHLMASRRHLYVEGYMSKPRFRVKALGRIIA